MTVLTVDPQAIAAARDRQERMLQAMLEHDMAVMASVLGEGPRYEFVPGERYLIVTLSAQPIPISDPTDRHQVALGFDYIATAKAVEPMERTLEYVGRYNQPPGYPHVFITDDEPHGHAFIADIDVLAYRRAGIS